jgi:GNAT superfamily N-acetyltransferase
MPRDFLGVYCVGTLPESRGRGIATSMLRAAEDYGAKLGCRYLTLQTVLSDGVTTMYIGQGYKIDFERDLLGLNW